MTIGIQHEKQIFSTTAPSDESKPGLNGTRGIKRSASMSDVSENDTKKHRALVDGFISQDAKKEAGSKTNMAGGPELRAPFVHITAYNHAEFESALREIGDNPDLENQIARIQADPAFIEAADTLRTQTTAVAGGAPRPGDAGFDIMTINTKSTDLLIGFLLLMLQSRAAEAKFNGAMTIKNAEAVASSADAMRSAGTTKTATALAAGAVGIGFGFAGAAVTWTAGHKSRMNEKHVLQPQADRKIETAQLDNKLHSAKGVKTDAELKLNVTKEDGSNKTLQVAPDDAELSVANRAKISDQINRNGVMDREDSAASAKNHQTISKWTLAGNLLTTTGGVGAVIGSSGQASVSVDEAVQRIAELNSRVAGQGADEAGKRAQSLIALIKELLDIMATLAQAKNAAAGAVAGNLKA